MLSLKKWVVLAGLMSASLSAYAVEAEQSTQKAVVDAMASNPFFADSKINVATRNYWKYLKAEEGGPKTVSSAWGQGLVIDYKSGYFADFIGFDATYYGVIKMGASDQDYYTRGLLYNNNGEADSFNKLGERLVKLKLEFDPVQFYVKGGWQLLRNVGVFTTSHRLASNNYLGWYGNMKADRISVEAAYITDSMNRDSPDKVAFTTRDGGYVNNVITGQVEYKDADFSATYFYGEANDYRRRHGFEGTYKPMSELLLRTQIYGTQAINADEQMSSGRRDFDRNAWHYAVDAKWQADVWSVKFGVAYTRAEKEDGIGYYPRHLVGNSRGRFNAMTAAGVDYTRDGETAFALIADYKLTNEFTAGFMSNYGQFNFKGNTIRSGEFNIFGRWAPSEIKNLSIYATVGQGWHYKNKNRNPTLDSNGDFQRAHSLSSDIIIDYKFGLL